MRSTISTVARATVRNAALTGMLGTSAAMAQTTSTLYGVLDVAMRHDSAAGERRTGMAPGFSSGGSRLGFRTREDLGSGWRAASVLEMGFNPDDGQMQTPGFGRQAYLGIGSDRLGMFSFGHQYVPMFHLSAVALDAFTTCHAGSTLLVQGVQGGMPLRASNMALYSYGRLGHGADGDTPPFSLAVAYAFGETASGVRSGSQASLAMGYGLDRWYLAYGGYVARAGEAPSARPRLSAHLLGGHYRFDAATVFLALHKVRNDAGGADKVARTNLSLTARIPAPGGQVLVGYQVSRDRTDARRSFSNVSAAYEYVLSRRTAAYVNYSHNANNRNGYQSTLLSPLTSAPNGADPSTWMLGLRHSF